MVALEALRALSNISRKLFLQARDEIVYDKRRNVLEVVDESICDIDWQPQKTGQTLLAASASDCAGVACDTTRRSCL